MSGFDINQVMETAKKVLKPLAEGLQASCTELKSAVDEATAPQAKEAKEAPKVEANDEKNQSEAGDDAKS